jgi:hypothetical protein
MAESQRKGTYIPSEVWRRLYSQTRSDWGAKSNGLDWRTASMGTTPKTVADRNAGCSGSITMQGSVVPLGVKVRK